MRFNNKGPKIKSTQESQASQKSRELPLYKNRPSTYLYQYTPPDMQSHYRRMNKFTLVMHSELDPRKSLAWSLDQWQTTGLLLCNKCRGHHRQKSKASVIGDPNSNGQSIQILTPSNDRIFYKYCYGSWRKNTPQVRFAPVKELPRRLPGWCRKEKALGPRP